MNAHDRFQYVGVAVQEREAAGAQADAEGVLSIAALASVKQSLAAQQFHHNTGRLRMPPVAPSLTTLQPPSAR